MKKGNVLPDAVEQYFKDSVPITARIEFMRVRREALVAIGSNNESYLDELLIALINLARTKILMATDGIMGIDDETIEKLVEGDLPEIRRLMTRLQLPCELRGSLSRVVLVSQSLRQEYEAEDESSIRELFNQPGNGHCSAGIFCCGAGHEEQLTIRSKF